MKSFLLKGGFILIMLLGLDMLFGAIMNRISTSIESGSIGKSNYISKELDSDVVIFGSSTAARHYNAQLLSDSMNTTCFNCGEPGHGIVFNYARLMQCKERYTPKIIIYDLIPGYDVEKNDNNQYLGRLKQFYDKDYVAELFAKVDSAYKWKMMSHFFRYNTTFLQYITTYFGLISKEKYKFGFMPLHGQIDALKIKEKGRGRCNPVDPLKEELMDAFVNSSTNSKLIFVISPNWYGRTEEELSRLYAIGKKYDKVVLDFSNDPKYVHNNELFYDGVHLNSKGADEFTKDLYAKLKSEELIQKNM